VTGLGRSLAAALLGLATIAPAAAADLPLWELGLGVGALRMPNYRGAEQSHDWVLPVPYAVYRGQFLRADRDGLHAFLVQSERVDLDLSLSASPPATSKDDRARSGMSDLAASVELGPSLNLTLANGAGWKFDFRAPLRAVLTVQSRPKMIGWTAAPKLNLDLDRHGWNLGLQAGPLWNSRRLNAYYYEVASAYASAERPTYTARGGFAGWQATASMSRRSGNRWTGLFLRWDSVGGAVFSDSPLVRRPAALVFGIAVSWSLLQSDRLVTGRDDTP
jgi:outer membrane protein